jgi:aminopeptidase YwaD
MLLNLAKAIQAKPIKYNVVFILFAGEEIGLLGSKYFTENPLLDLSKIKFLVNLDLNGTGDEGATVVNSTVFKAQFNLLKAINDQQKLLPQLKTRGKAANSDHYWFSEKGVPAFFIYTMGGISAYHDIYDKAETLPLTKYKELHQLLLSFIQQL